MNKGNDKNAKGTNTKKEDGAFHSKKIKHNPSSESARTKSGLHNASMEKPK